MTNSSVTAFPLYRRQKLVSGIAGALQSKDGDEANLFWRKTAKKLLYQLLAVGVSAEAAESEVRTLLHAVLSDMERRSMASAT